MPGAERWPDPDENLPADFEQRRTQHYAAFSKPLELGDFIDQVRSELRAPTTGRCPSCRVP